MRIAAVSSLVFVVVITAVVIKYASRGEAAPAPQSAANAIAEVDALQSAEASYYSQRGRYSERLADLFAATRRGSDIVMNASGLDINLDVSTDGQTMIVRVDSPAIALSRVLVRGEETGRTCVAMTAAASCP